MINFSQLLAARVDAIIERWTNFVREDRHMATDETLSNSAVQDHIPLVLNAIVTVLSKVENSDVQTLAEASLAHGLVRAQQGFDPTEVVREYRLLRSAIFSSLEPELITESPVEVYRVFRLIDLVVDEAIAQSFKSYVGERMKELDQLQSQVVMGEQEVTRLVRASQDTLSHQLTDQLRTPLSSAISYTELFLRQQQQMSDAHSIAPQIEHIERALRNSRQLLRLINDTTELLRYETGQLGLHLLPTNVTAIVKQTLQVMEPAIAEKGLQVIVRSEAAPPQVLSDPLRLQQILTNLLRNAVHFTPSGSIEIDCQELSNQHWSISVKDTGVGIPSEDQSRIFEPYFRVESNISLAEFEGTGLGLAIVLRLVRLLQGEIEVKSQPGVGSTFTIYFPMEVKRLDQTESLPSWDYSATHTR